MAYTIQSDKLTVTAIRQGGEVQSVTAKSGVELLWDGKADIWAGHAPVCFPWCGVMADGWYEAEGRQITAKNRHGFARNLEHQIVRQSASAMTFRLDWAGEEGSMFPWPCRLETTHQVLGSTVTTTCVATNKGTTPMPMQLGFHPGFRCPILPGDAMTDYQFRFQTGKVIPIEAHLFDNDSILFQDTGDFVRLERTDGEAYLEVSTAGFGWVLLWSKPGVPGFVCIEPWQGYPGPEHDPFQRPGAVALAPGESRSVTLKVEYHV